MMNKKNRPFKNGFNLATVVSIGLLLLTASCKTNRLLKVKYKPKYTQNLQNRSQQSASPKVSDASEHTPISSKNSITEIQKQPQSVLKDIPATTNPQQNETKDIPVAINPQQKLQEYDKDAPLLHWAVAHNHVEVVEFLVNIPSIDLNAKDKEGLTPYDLAQKNNNVELVNFLKYHPNPYDEKERLWPPLYRAIAGDSLAIVKLLVAYPRININDIHAVHGSPLYFAVSKSHNDTIETTNFLVKHPGIDLSQVQPSTWPPLLYLAAKNGYAEVVEFLIKRKDIDHIELNVNFVDDKQWTLLHWATARGYMGKSYREIVKTLVISNLGININARDKEDRTPLYLAAGNGCIEMVKFLVNLPSIDLNAKDKEGNTPYDIAQQRGHGDIVEIIRSRQSQNR